MKFSKFFANIQETQWYQSFLNPVIQEIRPTDTVLDIGTGSGKLIQILATEKGLDCTGIDTNEDMLKEAKEKLKTTNARLLKIEANQKLPFEDNRFNAITICSVLFHLKKEAIDFMLKDAQRLLKKEGKIMILTPTGKGNFIKLSQNYFSLKNLSVYIWFYATKRRAGPWQKSDYLKEYTSRNNLKYESKIVMNGFAQLEIITE